MDSINFQIGDLFFSWDERKSRENFRKHGVAFQEAATCWLDENAIETYDEEHSESETRWLMIGRSDVGRILTCWYTERRFGEQEVIRLIGARRSISSEKSMYYEEAKKR
jgi:hypothetical protein